MTDKAALLFAKVSRVNIAIEGMKTANSQHQISQPYTELDFLQQTSLIDAAIAEFQQPDLRVVDGEPPLGKCEACGSEVFEGDKPQCCGHGQLICQKCLQKMPACKEAPKA